MADEQGTGARFKRARSGGEAAPAEKPKRPQKPDSQTRSTVYIDNDDWQALRREAFEQALPINSLIVVAVRKFLATTGAEREQLIAEARRVTSERRG